MTATAKDVRKAEFAKIVAAHPGVCLAVVVNGKNLSCIKNTTVANAEGEVSLFADADAAGELHEGQEMTVNGKQAHVLRFKTDSSGAIVTITYRSEP